MSDLTTTQEGKLFKTGKLTTIGGAALAIVAMQFVAFNALMDVVMSVVLFGTGYLAGRITK